MSEQNDMNRRSYLKKSIATAAAVGGVAAASQSATAASDSATISGTGDYIISASETDPISGSVNGGSETITFDGYIQTAELDGDLEVDVTYNTSYANAGDVEVSGSNNSYLFGVTTDTVNTTSDCESSEGTDDTGSAWGELDWSDTDTFTADGVMDYLYSYESGGVTFKQA